MTNKYEAAVEKYGQLLQKSYDFFSFKSNHTHTHTHTNTVLRSTDNSEDDARRRIFRTETLCWNRQRLRLICSDKSCKRKINNNQHRMIPQSCWKSHGNAWKRRESYLPSSSPRRRRRRKCFYLVYVVFECDVFECDVVER